MRRRGFLKAAGAAMALPGLENVLGPLAAEEPPAFSRFRPIAPSDEDDLLLPEGFRYDVVLKWGDPFTAADEPFGYNNDFIGVFPLKDAEEALLVVNHEYISGSFAGDASLYDQTFAKLRGRIPTVHDYKADLGVSVVRVRRDGASGAWVPVLRDPLNRRISAKTPCGLDGPAAALLGGGPVEGTFDNCAGHVTPWGTALSCEENFDLRCPAMVDANGNFTTGGLFDVPGGHYGWVVEVDPFDPRSTPIKHTALGRFRHENVALRVEAGQPAVAYMGDDRLGGHVWKFVSDELYRPGDRESCRRLLSSGRLYAARFRGDGKGEWRLLDVSTPLDPNRDVKDLKPFVPRHARKLGDCYASQAAVLLDAYQAANAIGASPSGRPEDLELHPTDGSLFIAFTAAPGRSGPWQNTYGEVWRLEEEEPAPRSRRFRWSRFATGGPPDPGRAGRVFAQPDNLLFDPRGHLWFTTDIASDAINVRDDYKVFKNSGLFFAAASGPGKGSILQFASMPCETEGTGPAWSPDQQALFLSLQHPGERWGTRTETAQAPCGSNWPHKVLGAPPQPAVVAIRRG
jgi:secreted PhoX family phosphatase